MGCKGNICKMGSIKQEIYGYTVVEDNDVKELRLPSEIIKVLGKVEKKEESEEQ